MSGYKVRIASIAVLICLLVSGSVLAKSVTIRMALRAEDNQTIDMYKGFAEQFNAVNPGVTVLVENYGLNEFDDKMQVQMAAGTAPDVFYMHYSTFPQYASQGAFLRLSKYFERDRFDVKQFFPSTVSQITWKGESDYAVPRETSSLAFFYNSDMFDVSGLAYPSDKSTFNDVVSMGKVLTKDLNGDGTTDQFGMYAPTTWYLRNNIMWAFGGDLLSADNSEWTMNKPEAAAGIQWIADALNVSKFATTAWASRFAVQKTAMMFGGYWDILPLVNANSKFGWDVAPLPQGPAGRYVRTATGAHAIWGGTPNAEEAWSFVKFLSSKDTQLALAKRGTIMPALRAAALSSQFMEGLPKNRRVFIESIANWGRIDQVTSVFTQMNTEMDKALAPVWKGEKALQTVLTELKPVMDEMLKQRKK